MTDKLFDAIINTTIFEWLAVVCALIYVLLIAHESILCWAFAIISSSLYVFICIEAMLYLEAVLSVFYVLMGIYGWIIWNKKKTDNKPIASVSRFHILVFLLLLTLVSILLGYFFNTYTHSSLPYLDAPITVFSFLATWMAAKKYIENWLFWIAIDTASVFLYANRELYLSALLYLIYTFMAIYGYKQWQKIIKSYA